jgi:hypothetical protein
MILKCRKTTAGLGAGLLSETGHFGSSAVRTRNFSV